MSTNTLLKPASLERFSSIELKALHIFAIEALLKAGEHGITVLDMPQSCNLTVDEFEVLMSSIEALSHKHHGGQTH